MKKQANFIKNRTNFFNGWSGSSFNQIELALQDPLDDVILHSGNFSYIQVALLTNDFIDQTFWGSNWNRTEQMVKGC